MMGVPAKPKERASGRHAYSTGEHILFGDAAACARVATLRPIALAGGDGAVALLAAIVSGLGAGMSA